MTTLSISNTSPSDLQNARKLLGDKAIIGVSVSSVDEAVRAAKGGANYVGIGTLFATHT
jgi:thiamine-phosphate diphosphorylase/hydroxyethylthiazole kinase